MNAIKAQCLSIARIAAFVFAGIGASVNAWATASNTDATDIWWNPNESGWGINMINTGDFIFATMFVYGADGKPTWFAAGLEKGFYTSGPTFSGDLYATTGPYFGGSFDPDAVTRRKVGTMTFVLLGANDGSLTYSVDGQFVSRSVQRQPLTLDNYAGGYFVGYADTITGCLDPSRNHPGRDQKNEMEMVIQQTGTVMVIQFATTTDTACTHTGTYTQLGRMGKTSGNYICASGDSGTSEFFEMNNRPYIVSGRFSWTSAKLGCVTSGDFAGVR